MGMKWLKSESFLLEQGHQKPVGKGHNSVIEHRLGTANVSGIVSGISSYPQVEDNVKS